ncbi:MAG: hypothetical protein L0L09_10270 [Staphylococcus equorum]|uniref:Uncharacterized protein n=1 Tax=Staphylococcus equorum TaxID=246432 RepID=A0AAW7AFC7_9STAP|nr:hypothetical protein [Staphylococcus equorum]MDK9865292.1 hypothetical protein [Staphylococcus equorum]MDK9870065.1 hypothetical protein [Staphylococcus equorum]MDK9870634.1 hypothetical protein [Staphylococcus equorum]MDK9876032.1 hypothetical protein [Staphylococcus equorum]MDN6570496.1 hypothetical protein [Staphylococcus equorum]
MKFEKIISEKDEEKAIQEIIDVLVKYNLTINNFNKILDSVFREFYDNATLK